MNHKITLDTDGKPVLNGHKFDAIVYLNPQYAKEEEITFLESYVSKGGKLMIEGRAEYNFHGKNYKNRFEALYKKATVQGYSIEAIPRLGLTKNLLPDGCKTEDGAYVYTNYESLITDKSASFTVTVNNNTYTGFYKGLAVISFDKNGQPKKMAAAGLTELRRNNEVIVSFSKPTDIYLDKQTNNSKIIIADDKGNRKPEINKLF